MGYAGIRAVLVGFTLFALVSCAGANGVKEADLTHRRFVLETVDGVPFRSSFRTPEIEFGEHSRVFGQVCNRFTGQGEFAGNLLTARALASTRMFCSDEALNKLEWDFSEMLQNGVKITLTEDTLTLSGNGRTLVYKAAEGPR